MEKAFLGGWLAGSATAAVVSIIVFAIAYYAKPYIDKKIRAAKITGAKNKKIGVKKTSLFKRAWLQIRKHTIPVIVLMVVVVILWMIFTSFTGSGNTLAWWIIGIVGCILAGIVFFKFKHRIKVPSLPSVKGPWITCAVIVLCAIGLGWYLNHHHPSPERDTTTASASSPEVWANDPADLTATDGYLHAGANTLQAGTFYHLDIVSHKEYSFYTKDGVRIVNVTAQDNDDDYESFRITKDGAERITQGTSLPTGLCKINVDTTAVVYMKVIKK